MKLTKLRLAAASVASMVALALAGPTTGVSFAADRTDISSSSGQTVQAFNVIPDGDGIDLRSGYRTAEHNDTNLKGGILSPNATRIVFGTDMYFAEDHELGIEKVPESFGYFTDGNFWPDLSAESINSADLPGIKIHITNVTGPGKVYLWSAEDESTVLDGGAYELTGDTAISFPQERIATEWFFTRAGDYQVTAYVERTGDKPARSVASTLELRVLKNQADTVSEADDQAEPADPDAEEHEGEEHEGHDHEGHEGHDHDGHHHHDEAPEGGAAEHTPTHPENMVKFYNGHLDVFFINTNTDGSLNLQMKEDITGRSVVRPADSAIMMMGRDWYTDQIKWNNLPSDIKGGYVSPNSSARNMLYPGWSSNDYTKRGYSDLSLKFLKIKAPNNGKVALFHSTLTPGVAAADLKDGSFVINPGSELEIQPAGHKHFTWVFSEPGLYQMTAKVVGKHNGQPFESHPSIYTWYAQTDREDQPDLSAISNEIEDTEGSDHSEDSEETPSTTPENENNQATTPEVDTPDADQPVTLDHGHVDLFYVTAEGGKLQLQSKEDVTGLGVVRPAENLTLKVGENAKTQIPADYQKHLAPEGYYLSQNGESQTTQLFPGWDTNDVRPDFEAINLKFVDVSGPGKVFLFQNGDLGGGILPALTAPATGFRSVPATEDNFELNAGDSIMQPMPGHAHVNWLFEKPGTYIMKVQAEGVPVAGGDAVRSPVATYTWVVGDAAAAPEINPGATPEKTPETSPEPTPETKPEAIPQKTPEAKPETEPKAKADTETEAELEATPEKTQEKTPDTMAGGSTTEPSANSGNTGSVLGSAEPTADSVGGGSATLPKTGTGNLTSAGAVALLLMLAGFSALAYRRKQIMD